MPQSLPGGAVPLLVFPFDHRSLGELRRAINDCGARAGLVDIALSNFVLAVNEIVTNAVRHGGGRGEISIWSHDGDLWCQVVDHGRGIPRSRLNGYHRPRPGHIGGWGLWLARQLCRTVDIDTGKTGTRVLLQYPLPQPS